MLLWQSTYSHLFLGTLIYSVSLCGLFGISALYHRPQWSPQGRKWMRRLDHSAIFLLIAGTSTPLCLAALPTESTLKLLSILWAAAAIGIFQSLFWVKAPKWLAATLYIIMGWLALPYLPEMKTALGSVKLAYIVIGGVIYTLGALVYAFKKPNPFPRIFGYHEVFHLLVMIAALFHFMVIVSLVLSV